MRAEDNNIVSLTVDDEKTIGLSVGTQESLEFSIGEVITIGADKYTGSEVTQAYKKVNGAWVEVSDLTTVFDSSNKYVKG